jgi:glycosyltransferase involved in cell wall biosynthesis
MKLVGVLNEPPFDPQSWSGTARYFFGALQRQGLLADAVDVDMSLTTDRAFRLLNIGPNKGRWRERYHLDVRRFKWLSHIAAQRIAALASKPDGVLQIGAWYNVSQRVALPCFSYHDGNLALRLRAGHTILGQSHHAVQRALAWERSTYHGMTGIFTMSSWLADSFIKDFGVPAARVHVVGAGINFDTLPDPVADKQYGPRFLMVGKDFRRKGGPLLLEAFSQVRRNIPDAELILIGPQLSSPPDGVRCLGFLSKSNPQDLQLLRRTYAEAGIYVLPSLYEPFGISLLEGMANELPCIAANHCAMPEIVNHGHTGLVVEPGSAQSLADAMLQLARSPDMARQFGQAGRRRLLDHYTWDAVAARIGQVVTATSRAPVQVK